MIDVLIILFAVWIRVALEFLCVFVRVRSESLYLWESERVWISWIAGFELSMFFSWFELLCMDLRKEYSYYSFSDRDWIQLQPIYGTHGFSSSIFNIVLL